MTKVTHSERDRAADADVESRLLLLLGYGFLSLTCPLRSENNNNIGLCSKERARRRIMSRLRPATASGVFTVVHGGSWWFIMCPSVSHCFVTFIEQVASRSIVFLAEIMKLSLLELPLVPFI